MLRPFLDRIAGAAERVAGAAERVAHAQERIADASAQPEGSAPGRPARAPRRGKKGATEQPAEPALPLSEITRRKGVKLAKELGLHVPERGED